MDKALLLQKIIESLTAEIEAFTRSAQNAREEATNEQSKAENKYDTRGLEASYLAHGQSRQALETLEALRLYQVLEPGAFGAKTPIELGALVELQSAEECAWYFLGPAAGGTEIAIDGKTVFVITPQSPMGRELLGRKQGMTLPPAGVRPSCRISRVL